MSPIVLDQPALNASGIHPALRSFADECRAVFVRLLAYVSGLAVLAVIIADLFSVVPVRATTTHLTSPGWILASRPNPAFSVSQLDLSNKSDAYTIMRHPDGGRKDTLRWAVIAGESPTVEIEIYRPGLELDSFVAPEGAIATRMGLPDTVDAETAGMIDTKFGPVTLYRFGGDSAKAKACLAFARTFDQPRMRISGWSCQADTPAAQRTLLGNTLNRLGLLSAGNDPKLAELFARAELKRTGCLTCVAPAADWLVGPQEPQLRGGI